MESWHAESLWVIAPLGMEDTNQIQPIPNQRIKVYPKSNYFDQAIVLPESVRTSFEYAGQDYLVAYWMARAFGVLGWTSGTQTVTAVSWQLTFKRSRCTPC